MSSTESPRKGDRQQPPQTPETDTEDESGLPRTVLRGADMLLFAIIPVGVVSVLPFWGGEAPTHTMFTAALVFNIVGFQFGFLPTIYPADWYADREQTPRFSRASPPIKRVQDAGEADSDRENRSDN